MVVEKRHCARCGDTGQSGPCQLCPECLGTSREPTTIMTRPDRERKVPKFTQLELDYLDEMFERRMEDPRA